MTLRILLAAALLVGAVWIDVGSAAGELPSAARDVDDKPSQKMQQIQPPPPTLTPEESAVPPWERLNPFPEQTLTPSIESSASRSPLVVPQNPRLGTNFANYYKASGLRAYGDMRNAGVSHDRITFDWFRLQPSPGSFDSGVAEAYDVLVNDATTANISLLGILIGPPGWAKDPAYGGAYGVPANLDRAWNDPQSHWGQFVYQTVARYKTQVRAWEVWNEPNLSEFWPASPQLFARLTQAAYQAIKAADPTATVVLGSAYRGVNIERIAGLFQSLRDLPDAALNNFYHDVIGFHLYDGGHCSPFDELAYLRDFFWRPYVGDKPIWITESGIRVWESPRDDGYALPNESASFLITNYAYALYHNAQRYYYFRAVDPSPDDPQPWGLLKADGVPRPSFTALQVAAQYLPSQFDLATRAWLNGNAVSQISFYTAQGRVSVLWNITNTGQFVSLASSAPSITLVQQDGVTSTVTLATAGQYVFTLSPAQNFRWNHHEGICQVASPPLIVIEAGVTVPHKLYLPMMNR